MKNIILVLLFSVFMYAGCGNKSSTNDSHDHGDGLHTHENGEVHQHNDTMQQQEFTIEQDSVIMEQHNHNCDTSHSHPH
jgi:hypothetical protein